MNESKNEKIRWWFPVKMTPWVVAGTILYICMGLFIFWSDHYRILEPVSADHSLKMGIFLFIVVLTVLTGPIIFLVNRINGTKWKPETIFIAVMLGIPAYGIGGSSYVIANALLDKAPMTTAVAQVVNMKESRGSRHSTYIIQVSSDKLKEIYKFYAPGKFYHQVSVGDMLILSVKPGYFGEKWLYKFELYNKGISNLKK